MWSWILALCGITGTFIVGTKNKLGWVVLFFNESLWLVYATQTKQYGFYLGSIAYMAVYVKNHRSWSKNDSKNSGTVMYVCPNCGKQNNLPYNQKLVCNNCIYEEQKK